MIRADIERRIAHIEKRLATEELPDWEREMITRNLRQYEKEIESFDK